MKTETIELEVPEGTGMRIETLALALGVPQIEVIKDLLSSILKRPKEAIDDVEGAFEWEDHEKQRLDAVWSMAAYVGDDWQTFRRIVDTIPPVPVVSA